MDIPSLWKIIFADNQCLNLRMFISLLFVKTCKDYSLEQASDTQIPIPDLITYPSKGMF